MVKIAEEILSILFPPRFPNEVNPRLFHFDREFEEQGSCGRAQIKQYRDAVERHWRERE